MEARRENQIGVLRPPNNLQKMGPTKPVALRATRPIRRRQEITLGRQIRRDPWATVTDGYGSVADMLRWSRAQATAPSDLS